MNVNWNLRNKHQWNLKWNSHILIQENAFENVVCEMAAIFSQPQCVYILKPWQNGSHFSWQHFRTYFLVWRLLNFDCYSLKFVPKGPIDLALNRQKAIIWANAGLDYWHVYVSFSLDELTHWGQVTHICVSRLDHHWFRWWLGAWSVPSHYLNQWWKIINSNLRNKLQWNLKQNSYIFIQENVFENGICEMVAILSWPQCVNTLLMIMTLVCLSLNLWNPHTFWVQKRIVYDLFICRSRTHGKKYFITWVYTPCGFKYTMT